MSVLKKFPRIILAAAVAAITTASSSANVTVDGLCYQLSGTYAYVTAPAAGTNYSGDIVIPESITAEDGTTYTVTKILNGSFDNCMNVTSITVPASVSEIQATAFRKLTLESFSILDGTGSLTVSRKSSSNVTGAFDGCTVKNLHIGRNISLNTGAVFISYSTIGNISWGNSIFVIPSDLFASGCRLTDNGTDMTIMTIPEGITEIQAGALQFLNMTSLRLPSTLRTMGEGIVDGDIGTGELDVISMAVVPPAGSVFSGTGKRFRSLTIPAGSTKYYRNYGWDKLTENGEMTEAESTPQPGGTTQPIADPVYLTLCQPAGSGNQTACGSPRFAVQRGGGISIEIEVADGWKLTSATLDPRTDSGAPDAYTSDKDNNGDRPQVVTDGPAEGNIYTINVTGLNTDYRLGYILEEETRTSAAMTSGNTNGLTVTASCGNVRVTANGDTYMSICDSAGRLTATRRLNAGETTTLRLPSHGIYLLNASGQTFKIIW